MSTDTNPFQGWTIQPWDGDELYAVRDGEKSMVGYIYPNGWAAWLPSEEKSFTEGRSTGAKPLETIRREVEGALREAGAQIP